MITWDLTFQSSALELRGSCNRVTVLSSSPLETIPRETPGSSSPLRSTCTAPPCCSLAAAPPSGMPVSLEGEAPSTLLLAKSLALKLPFRARAKGDLRGRKKTKGIIPVEGRGKRHLGRTHLSALYPEYPIACLTSWLHHPPVHAEPGMSKYIGAGELRGLGQHRELPDSPVLGFPSWSFCKGQVWMLAWRGESSYPACVSHHKSSLQVDKVLSTPAQEKGSRAVVEALWHRPRAKALAALPGALWHVGLEVIQGLRLVSPLQLLDVGGVLLPGVVQLAALAQCLEVDG